MIKFIRLLEFELGRFMKFLIPVIILSGIVQFVALFSMILGYKDYLKNASASNVLTQTFSMHDLTGGGLFPLAILIIPLLFIVYSFFTWYREWLGKNTFIYRLLMLPINRMAIFYSKAITFLLGGLIAFAIQFGLYTIISVILKNVIQAEHFIPLNIHNVIHPYEMVKQVLFPTSGYEFLHTYGFAFAALLVLFTAILMERTYNLRGLIVGIVYFTGYFLLYTQFNALYYANSTTWMIRPSQIFLLKSAYIVLMMLISSVISHLLLKNKVKV